MWSTLCGPHLQILQHGAQFALKHVKQQKAVEVPISFDLAACVEPNSACVHPVTVCVLLHTCGVALQQSVWTAVRRGMLLLGCLQAPA